jgi:hypothetical protein
MSYPIMMLECPNFLCLRKTDERWSMSALLVHKRANFQNADMFGLLSELVIKGEIFPKSR